MSHSGPRLQGSGSPIGPAGCQNGWVRPRRSTPTGGREGWTVPCGIAVYRFVPILCSESGEHYCSGPRSTFPRPWPVATVDQGALHARTTREWLSGWHLLPISFFSRATLSDLLNSSINARPSYSVPRAVFLKCCTCSLHVRSFWFNRSQFSNLGRNFIQITKIYSDELVQFFDCFLVCHRP